MSNPPYGGMPPTAAPWPPQGPPPGRGSSRLPLILTAAVAMIAIVVAIASWFRPMPEPEAQAAEPQFSEQEIADAEDAMCNAWRTSYDAIRNVASKNSQDDTLTYVLNLESQVVFDTSADYIQTNLRNHPATPDRLAEQLGRLSISYQDMVLARLTDLPESDVEPIKTKMNSAESSIRRECE